jgi:hypothetical protein
MKSQDSEDDEGFIPSKMEIKSEQKQTESNDGRGERPTDLQPRFISGDGILR